MTDNAATIVRHFRQIVLWPLQLVPETHTGKMQRHWEHLSAVVDGNAWREVRDEFPWNPDVMDQAHYREFVTFLPFVQRFLYGSRVGKDPAQREGAPSIRTFRRRDITHVRVTYSDDMRLTFELARVELHFFLDADIVLHAIEMCIDDAPLDRVQDTMFRFGRAYPGFWDANGEGAHCPRLVEWLDASGAVRAQSDYSEPQEYLDRVARQRTARLSAHWTYLLEPLRPADNERNDPLRFRPIEYYRMPFMAYLAVDDPTALSRADFARIALATAPGGRDVAPFSTESLATFEADYCEDKYWAGSRNGDFGGMRILVSSRVLAMVGRREDPTFCGAKTGMLGQFRRQYFLLFLIAHFHRAALLSMSDQLAVAMDRLEIADTESVKRFKRAIRQTMEVFLRFTHRYWYHQVSNQDLARSLFHRMRTHLGIEVLYEEVRQEVMDMSGYLDSDSLRRQANTVLRLTVVTIMAMIGTIATGFLGMNLIAAADDPLALRAVFFALVFVVTGALTMLTVAKSKRLAESLDALSDERLGWREKWSALVRAWRG